MPRKYIVGGCVRCVQCARLQPPCARALLNPCRRGAAGPPRLSELRAPALAPRHSNWKCQPATQKEIADLLAVLNPAETLPADKVEVVCGVPDVFIPFTQSLLRKDFQVHERDSRRALRHAQLHAEFPRHSPRLPRRSPPHPPRAHPLGAIHVHARDSAETPYK